MGEDMCACRGSELENVLQARFDRRLNLHPPLSALSWRQSALTNGLRYIQHQFVVPEQFSTALSFYSSQLQFDCKIASRSCDYFFFTRRSFDQRVFWAREIAARPAADIFLRPARKPLPSSPPSLRSVFFAF